MVRQLLVHGFLCVCFVGCGSTASLNTVDAGVLSDSGLVLPIDQDNDGVVASDDCDDRNDQLGARSHDGDCDGHLQAVDCDDANPASTHRGEDADCDGYLPPDDCNDNNADIYPGAQEDWDDGVDQDCDGNRDSICGDAAIGNI